MPPLTLILPLKGSPPITPYRENNFDQWRATRPKRGKIPDLLWGEVKAIIGRYPLTQITQALGMNTNQISLVLNQKANKNIIFVEAKTTQKTSTINKPASLANLINQFMGQ